MARSPSGAGPSGFMRTLPVPGARSTTPARTLRAIPSPSRASEAPTAGRTATAGRAASATGCSPAGHDLDVAVAHLRRADRQLGRLVVAVGPCGLRTRPTGSTVAALAESIVSQQLSGRAAATIYRRLCALFPRPSAGPTISDLPALSAPELRGVACRQAAGAVGRSTSLRATEDAREDSRRVEPGMK